MKLLDLFAGIGGFSLAAHWLDWETVAFVEKDEFCQKVLRKNFGADIEIYDDITTFSGKPFRGRCDVISGGFPCQPFSVAGQQKGSSDERHLFPEMLRVIQEVKPTFVVAENVRGLLSIESGETFNGICASLERLDYTVQTFIIPACAVNAPHRRDRVWIVAHSERQRLRGRYNEISGSNGKVSERHENAEFSDSNCQSIADSEISKRELARRTRSGRKGFANNVGTFTDTANAAPARQRRDGGQILRESESIRFNNGDARSGWRENWLEVATEFCRMDARVSFELDIIRRGLNYDESSDTKSDTKRSSVIRKILRYVWDSRELAAASPGLYKNGLLDSLPNLPQGNSYEGWLVGQRLGEDEGLRDLFQAFYAATFKKSQNLQQRVLERIGQIERSKKVEHGQRTDRLRSLGNAIVPQIAYEIFKAIEEAETLSDRRGNNL